MSTDPNHIARVAANLRSVVRILESLGAPIGTDGFHAVGSLSETSVPRSYRTEPIEGAELGGRPHNPEDDVIDEITRLVDWQLEEGKR